MNKTCYVKNSIPKTTEDFYKASMLIMMIFAPRNFIENKDDNIHYGEKDMKEIWNEC